MTGAFCLVAKFSNAFLFGLAYIYGAELFPTVVRSKCMGLGISIGRGVSMFAPFINLGMNKLELNPLLAYGIWGLACIPILACLPETLGKKMPDNLEESFKGSVKSALNRSSIKTKSYVLAIPA